LAHDADGAALLVLVNHNDGAGERDDHLAQAALLEPVACGFGGRTWWLRCPRCDRRCRIVYGRPGVSAIVCRACHSLTYKSRQKSRSRSYRLFRTIDTLLRLDADLQARSWRRRVRALHRFDRVEHGVRRVLEAAGRGERDRADG
jgi:hypothetical protein